MGALFSARKPKVIVKPTDRTFYKSYVGDFGIVKTLGTGASCKVKLAFTKDDEKPVALKIMNEGDKHVMELMR